MPQRDPMIGVRLVQGEAPAVERSLHAAFTSAARETAGGEPERIAARAAQQIGGGCRVMVEAERGLWSRYRVAIRVQGVPVTIATVEVTQPS